MADISGNGSIDHVPATIANLQDELNRCKADKEFVWSLWRRLQSTRPDLTAAITMVVEREKNKAEDKDKKILEVMRSKDAYILQLQETINQTEKTLQDKKKSLDDKEAQLSQIQQYIEDEKALHLKEKNELFAEKQVLNDLIQTKETQSKLKDELNDKHLKEQQGINEALESKVNNLEEAVSKSERKMQDLKVHEKQLLAKQQKYLDRCNTLTAEKEEITAAFAQKQNILEQQHTQSVQQYIQEAEEKDKHIKALQKELKSCSKEVQKQSDDIQNIKIKFETEKKNIENQYERKLESLQAEMNDVMAQFEQLRNREQQNQLERKNQKHLESDVIELEEEVEQLSNSLQMKDRLIESLERALAKRPMVNDDENSTNATKLNTTTSNELPLSPSEYATDYSDSSRDTLIYALTKKTAEVHELKRAHKNRLNRLKSLQEAHKLALQQLQTYDEYQRERTTPPPRVDGRLLRQEDSDAVWNELAHYRVENQILRQQNIEDQEEIDCLRVRVAHDAAAIQELEKVVQQKESYQKLAKSLELRHNNLSDELAGCKFEAKTLEQAKQTLEIDKMKIIEERSALQEEVNILKRSVESMYKQQQVMKNVIARERELQSPLTVESKIQQEMNSSKAAVEEKLENTSKRQIEDEQFSRDDSSKVNTSVQTETSINKENHKTTVIENLEKQLLVLEQRLDQQQKDQANLNDHVSIGVSTAVTTMNKEVQTEDLLETDENSEFSDDEDKFKSDVQDLKDKVNIRQSSPIGKTPSKPSYPSTQPKKRMLYGNQRLGAKNRSLKAQVQSLRRQIRVVHEAKRSIEKLFADAKVKNHQLESEFNLAQQRLKLNKQSLQKLSKELEECQSENFKLQKESIAEIPPPKRTENDWRQLELKVKTYLNDCARLNNQVKSLKNDLTTKDESLKSNQDRLNRLERSVVQKKVLIDELKSKVKSFQEELAGADDSRKEIEQHSKAVLETSNFRKKQVLSLKQKLAFESQARQDLQQKYAKCQLELDRKNMQLNQVQAKYSRATAVANAVEAAATEQMQGLANDSQNALSAAREKLKQAYQVIDEFNAFAKALIEEMLKQLGSYRNVLATSPVNNLDQEDLSSDTIKKAKLMACSILNLSDNDLDEIMQSATALQECSKIEEQKKEDEIWLKRLHTTLNSKPPFAASLLGLILDILQSILEVSNGKDCTS
ncbi:Centlein [Trichoplax sp. H2]|nr:Centlein [Trichoplax sp. H2]|eukprot:RDD40369.1 Centlein [Trichoplax sp. H2]